MVRSMFSGVAGLRAHQTKMDVIGNNIANVNTYAYKAQRAVFRDAFYQTTSASSNPSGAMGGANSSQIGYGSQIASIDVMHTRGNFAATDNPSDMMIMGNGYFLMGPINATGYIAGDGSISALNLTRVGNLSFDSAGYLTDPAGNVVYGFVVDDPTDTPPTFDTSKVMPIRRPTTGTAPNEVVTPMTNIKFSPDGTIVGTNTATGKVVTIAQIAVANVPNPNGLEMTESSFYKAFANTGKVTAQVPGEGGTGSLKTGGLEMANVDLSKEFSDMITTQRGFQANTRIITVTDEMLQELVNLKR